MLPSRWTCSGGARICPTGSQAPSPTDGWGGAVTRSPDNGDVLPKGRNGVAKSWVFAKKIWKFEFYFIKETIPMSGRQISVGIHSLYSIIHSQGPDKTRKFHRRGGGGQSHPWRLVFSDGVGMAHLPLPGTTHAYVYYPCN